MTRTVFLVWNEAMTQGIVLTSKSQADDLHHGIFTAGDLTEAMVNLHGEETLTVDRVELGGFQ